VKFVPSGLDPLELTYVAFIQAAVPIVSASIATTKNRMGALKQFPEFQRQNQRQSDFAKKG
jgi:hypothetical protein